MWSLRIKKKNKNKDTEGEGGRETKLAMAVPMKKVCPKPRMII